MKLFGIAAFIAIIGLASAQFQILNTVLRGVQETVGVVKDVAQGAISHVSDGVAHIPLVGEHAAGLVDAAGTVVIEAAESVKGKVLPAVANTVNEVKDVAVGTVDSLQSKLKGLVTPIILTLSAVPHLGPILFLILPCLLTAVFTILGAVKHIIGII